MLELKEFLRGLFEGISARFVESRKTMNKFADGLLGTLECDNAPRL